MAYSEDLKQRVLAYIAAGASKVEAARLFSLGRATIYIWLGQPPDHQRRKPGPKPGHKIDHAKLAQLIEAQPGLPRRELARLMGVSVKGISRALLSLKRAGKKNTVLPTRIRARRRHSSTKNTSRATGEKRA